MSDAHQRGQNPEREATSAPRPSPVVLTCALLLLLAALVIRVVDSSRYGLPIGLGVLGVVVLAGYLQTRHRYRRDRKGAKDPGEPA